MTTNDETINLATYDRLIARAQADEQHQTTNVETVEKTRDGEYDVRFQGSTCMIVPIGYRDPSGNPMARAPLPGDRLRLYGRGLGYPVRGIARVLPDLAPNDVVAVWRYESAEEETIRFEREVKEKKEADRAAWEASKDEVAAKIAALPAPFQKRFEFFMRSPTWGPEFGKYEIFTMQEAVKIHAALKTIDAIANFNRLHVAAQLVLVPDLATDHSGNTLGAAASLAHIYAQALALAPGPDAVEVYQQHGALCPLVGCKTYGCYSTTVVKPEPPSKIAAISAVDPFTHTKEQRERMLREMRAASDAFYATAVRIGHHQFVEFAGFMNEAIKIWKDMSDDDIDFATTPMRAKPHQMEYIGEKFDCIFGQALLDLDTRRAFLVALAEHGGWEP